ncbi:MAG: cell division protein FtsB [Woeseiaceae bacterium]|nr:cell division protein FtsB [Woeseiaceae bacterium]
MRWILGLLAIVAVLLQGELWFSDDGYLKTLKLRTAVAEQRELNKDLRERNASLDAEVLNLKQGLEAAEERARTDLGLIGETETFYQVVQASASQR